MKKERLIIAYGDENVTLNKGGEHIILNKRDMAFIVQSVIKNINLMVITEDND